MSTDSPIIVTGLLKFVSFFVSDGYNRSHPESSATPGTNYSPIKTGLNHPIPVPGQPPRMPTFFQQHPLSHAQLQSLSEPNQAHAFAQNRLATSWLHHQLHLASQGNQLLKPNPISPWQNVMLNCRSQDHQSKPPYFPYTSLSNHDSGFNRLPRHPNHFETHISAPLEAGSQMNTSMNGSDDSLDKTSEIDDDEEVQIVPAVKPESSNNNNTKKRNPYSIEELLKKPSKLTKLSPERQEISNSMVLRQPCGILLSNESESAYVRIDSPKMERSFASDHSLSPRSYRESPDSCYAENYPSDGRRDSCDEIIIDVGNNHPSSASIKV